MKVKLLTNSEYGATTENAAAEKLKDILLKSIPIDVKGQITIAPNVTLRGQSVRDIDLVVWGNLSNCVLPHLYKDETAESTKDLQVKDFFLVIELKQQPIEKLSYEGRHIWVEYGDEIKDATHQSESQRYAMKAFLQEFSHLNVFLANVIWLNSVSDEDLKKLTNGIPVGALPSYFCFKDLIEILIIQGLKPRYDKENNRYVLSSGIDSEEVNSSIINVFKQ